MWWASRSQPCPNIEIRELTSVSVMFFVSVVVSCTVLIIVLVFVFSSWRVMVSKQVEVRVEYTVIELPQPAAHDEPELEGDGWTFAATTARLEDDAVLDDEEVVL
jgi:hypothetical protein